MRLTTASFLSVLLFAANVFAAGWSDLSGGQHSFKTLGPQFYKDVPVRRIPNARVRLSFINEEAVRRLGLDLPSDPRAVEALLVDHFAWEVDPDKKSEKIWFATHYLDSAKKEVGGALGDGRALWTGELKLQRPDGKILYVDGVQKGVGPTPLAWTNNPSHSDGRQNTNELIISGIRSMADMGNELDSTADLLGFTITSDSGDIRSMSLRVGRQTRPATIRYHKDNQKDAKTITDYIVRRDLGLPLTAAVTDALFLEWEKQFTLTNAQDSARLFALNAFYEHPTAGNKTSTGGSIDLNGRQYLDAYHVNMTHLYGRLRVGDQAYLQAGYSEFINDYLKEAQYRSNINFNALNKQMYALFFKTFKDTAARMFLRNLGFDSEEIGTLSPSLRLEVFRAVNNLMRATGNEKVSMMLHNNVVPAAFDTRKILKGTLAAMALPTAEARTEAMAKLYTVDRKWNSTKRFDHMPQRERYETAVKSVIEKLGGEIRPEWLANAEARVKLERYDATSEGIWDQWAHPIRLKAESGAVMWPEISNLMQQAAATFVDGDPVVRKSGMLKSKLPIFAPTCSAAFGKAG